MPAISAVSTDDEATRESLRTIAKDAFPFGQHWFVHLSDHTLAARHEGTIVGGAVLGIYDAGGQRVGIIEWLFTAESARGLGVGQELVEQAFAYLDEQDCDRVLTIVEWHNTSSSKLFAYRGFRKMSAWTALGIYGLRQSVRIWGYFPIGCHLWERPLGPDDAEAPPDALVEGGSALTEAAVANALLLLVAVAMSVGVGATAAHAGPIALVAVLFLAVRHLPRRMAAWWAEGDWGYRSWSHTYPFALLIALLGGYLPAPGGYEPARATWTYRDDRRTFGAASLCSAVVLVGLLAVVALGHAPFDGVPDPVRAAMGFSLGVYVVVDVLAIVWPATMYNATALYRWNRWGWGVMAFVAAGLFGLWIM